MTTHIDRIPSYEQSSPYDYRERLKRETEEVLFHPAINRLLTAAAEDDLIPDMSVEMLSALSDKKTYAASVASLMRAAFDRRSGTGVERHQLRDETLPSRIREVVRETIDELYMTADTPIPEGSFEIATVLGATAPVIAKRTNYLYDALEKGTAQTSILVGLGAERPLIDVDKKHAYLYPYVSESEVETELLAGAAKDWFAKNDYPAPAVDPSVPAEAYVKDGTYGSKYRIQTVTFEDETQKPQWAPGMIINLSPPFEKGHHPRANTGETIRFLLELAELAPGSKLLFASSQPYLLGQKFEIQRLCLDNDIEVEVAGYGVDSSRFSAAALADEIAKAITKAATLYTELQ